VIPTQEHTQQFQYIYIHIQKKLLIYTYIYNLFIYAKNSRAHTAVSMRFSHKINVYILDDTYTYITSD